MDTIQQPAQRETLTGLTMILGDEMTEEWGDVPDVETLEQWLEEGGCEATDGCWTEPDGVCEHGHQSWLLVMGLI